MRILPLVGLEHELQNLRSSGVLCAPCGYCAWKTSTVVPVVQLWVPKYTLGHWHLLGRLFFLSHHISVSELPRFMYIVECPVWENPRSPSRCENPKTLRESKETNPIFDYIHNK